MTAFALALLLGAAAAFIAAGAAPPRTQSYLRLAAVLYGALAISEALGLAAAAVTDIAATLGAAALSVGAFAGFRHAPGAMAAFLFLLIATLCGIGAAAFDWRVMAAAPQVASATVILAVASPGLRRRSSLYLGLAALSLLGVAACELAPGFQARAGLLLFAAAAVSGVAIASDLLVENGGTGRSRRSISRSR